MTVSRSATAAEYTVTRPSRTKPQSVMRRSSASSTASDDGAPTATRIGQPATDAFCTSSKDSRPLTQRSRLSSGSSPSRNAQPTTLSIALWRPTSSRTHSSSPSAVKSPVAWRPPVAANARCASRKRSGSADTSSRPTRRSLVTGGAWTAIASIAPFPQTPQEDEV